MRVLLLSSTLGFGHVKAAQAIEQALLERDPGVSVEYVDFWSLMEARVAAAVKEGYLEIVTQEPEIYDRLHGYDSGQWRAFFREPRLPPPLTAISRRVLDRWFPGRNGFPVRGENLDQTLFLNLFGSFFIRPALQGNLVRRGLVLWVHTLLARRMKQRIQGFDPDVVVSTQMMPATVLAAVKRRGELNGVPAVAVLTDYGVHDFWLRANMDHYCVATDAMAADLRARSINDAPVSVTGIPLLAGFRQPLPQAEARRRLGLDGARPTILVTGGGCGIGTSDALRAILESGLDCQVLVAAAAPQADRERLQALAAGCSERVTVYAERVDMPVLVRAADVVVGKPGGLSVSEALACGRPFLAVCSLGGQESFNVAYLQRHEVGGPVEDASLVAQLRHWLSRPEELTRVQDRAWALGEREGATAIASSLLGGWATGAQEEQP